MCKWDSVPQLSDSAAMTRTFTSVYGCQTSHASKTRLLANAWQCDAANAVEPKKNSAFGISHQKGINHGHF